MTRIVFLGDRGRVNVLRKKVIRRVERTCWSRAKMSLPYCTSHNTLTKRSWVACEKSRAFIEYSSRSPAWQRGEAGSFSLMVSAKHFHRRGLRTPGQVLSLLGIREQIQKRVLHDGDCSHRRKCYLDMAVAGQMSDAGE
jgi:hypothetical protein